MSSGVIVKNQDGDVYRTRHPVSFPVDVRKVTDKVVSIRYLNLTRHKNRTGVIKDRQIEIERVCSLRRRDFTSVIVKDRESQEPFQIHPITHFNIVSITVNHLLLTTLGRGLNLVKPRGHLPPLPSESSLLYTRFRISYSSIVGKVVTYFFSS